MKKSENIIVVRPRTGARAVQGWAYLIMSLSFQAMFFAHGIVENLASPIFWGLFWFAGVYLGLRTITMRIELSGDKFSYSHIFLRKRPLRMSDIKSVFTYKMPDNLLVPTVAYKWTSKVVYIIEPADHKPRVIEIDSSMFPPEQFQKVIAFFGDMTEGPLEYKEGFYRAWRIKRSAKAR